MTCLIFFSYNCGYLCGNDISYQNYFVCIIAFVNENHPIMETRLGKSAVADDKNSDISKDNSSHL